jgi:hypothetical protein
MFEHFGLGHNNAIFCAAVGPRPRCTTFTMILLSRFGLGRRLLFGEHDERVEGVGLARFASAVGPRLLEELVDTRLYRVFDSRHAIDRAAHVQVPAALPIGIEPRIPLRVDPPIRRIRIRVGGRLRPQALRA